MSADGRGHRNQTPKPFTWTAKAKPILASHRRTKKAMAIVKAGCKWMSRNTRILSGQSQKEVGTPIATPPGEGRLRFIPPAVPLAFNEDSRDYARSLKDTPHLNSQGMSARKWRCASRT